LGNLLVLNLKGRSETNGSFDWCFQLTTGSCRHLQCGKGGTDKKAILLSDRDEDGTDAQPFSKCYLAFS